jgi:hypothetical protein
MPEATLVARGPTKIYRGGDVEVHAIRDAGDRELTNMSALFSNPTTSPDFDVQKSAGISHARP